MASYRRAVVIYNPAAGGRRLLGRRQVEEAVEVLRVGAGSVDAWPTPGPGQGAEMARRAVAEGADLVLACGGDGTINEVVNGLAGSEAALAILPAGTGNVLGLELGLPLDPVKAAGRVGELEPRRIALGRVNGRYFHSMCGAGLDAEIVYHLDLRSKARLGKLAYFLAAARELTRRRERIRASVDGRESECTFALAARAAYYGGSFRIARLAHLLDDGFQAALFPSRSNLRYLVYLGATVTGNIHRLGDVLVTRAKRMELTGPGRIQVDGEYAGRLPAVVEAVAGALTLLVPRRYIEAHG